MVSLLLSAVYRPYSYSGDGKVVALPLHFQLTAGEILNPSKPLIITFALRTTMPNTQLSLIVDANNISDYLSVALTAGLLTVSYDYGCGPTIVQTSSPLNNGAWHVIQISRTCSQVAVVVDDGADSASGTSASIDTSAWRTQFAIAAPGRRTGFTIMQTTGISLQACAWRCIDHPLCAAFNYLAAGNSSMCEPLSSVSSTLSSAPLSTLYQYFEALPVNAPILFGGADGQINSDVLVTTLQPPLKGCMGGVSINTWSVDVASAAGMTLTPCL